MASKIRFVCITEPEISPPEDHFATGDAADDAAICAKIRKDAEWNDWAWCQVKVVARFWGFEGASTWLGACSYANEAEFRRPGDYFDDLCVEATDDLRKKIATAIAGEDETDADHARAAMAALGERNMVNL